MDGFRHLISMPVRFHDIDAMGHVNNGVYFSYMETARVNYMAKAGLQTDFRDLKRIGIILAEISCRFKKPIFFGQSVEVGTRVGEMRHSSLLMEHRIDADGEIAALAQAVLVRYDYDTGKSIRISDAFRARIEAFEGYGRSNAAVVAGANDKNGASG